jgi:arsenite methyltransferase
VKVDYGPDAPGLDRRFAIAGAALLAAAVALALVGVGELPELVGLCGVMFLATVSARSIRAGAASSWSATACSTASGCAATRSCSTSPAVAASWRALPFADASSTRRLVAGHPQTSTTPRTARACREIVRVRRPGARVAILDFRATAYALAFEDFGVVDVARSKRSFRMYPPVRVITARRPPGDYV